MISFLAIIPGLKHHAFTQVPQKCFEIESILVDGCDSGNEGKNEMVFFHIGQDSININDLRVDGAGSTGVIQAGKWPNTSNPWLGICASPNASAKLDTLNAAIAGCGYLLEPTGGILPAGSRVILITSTDFTVITSYFQNLNDTVYVIFQCSGNTSGHFANFSTTSSARTLVWHHILSGCADTVAYDRSLLTDINGIPAGQDGGAVQFNWDNTASYYNNGCQAPFIPLYADISFINIVGTGNVCVGDTIQMQALTSGSYSEILWWGGTGNFSDTDSVYTNYIVSAGDTLSGIMINIRVIGACSDTVYDTDTFFAFNPPVPSINISGNDTICQGTSLALNASGGTGYLWSTGSASQSILVNDSGTYSVTVSNSCGSGNAFKTITLIPLPASVIYPAGSVSFCQGDSVLLMASAENIVWSTNETTDTITVKNPGIYYAIALNECGSDTDSVFVNIVLPPVAVISPGNSAYVCQDDSITFIASGGSSYAWSTGATTGSITIQSAGTYYVTVSAVCGSSYDSVFVSAGLLPSAIISSDDSGTICSGDTVLLTASGGDNYVWSTGAQNSFIPVTGSGTFSVTASNSCGSDTTSWTIIEIFPPLAAISPSDSTFFCQNDSVTLTASGGDILLWSTGETTSSIVVQTVELFFVTVSNSCGSNYDSVRTAIKSDPVATITAGGPAILCPGGSVTLTASGGNIFLWSNNNNSSSIIVDSENTFWVSVTNSCGSDTASLSVKISDINASFLPDNVSGGAPIEVTFENNSTNVVSYYWDFGDGGFSSASEPSYIYNTPGEYTVVLTATDGSGCTDTAVYNKIDVSSVIFIPNIFSPNNDGANDIFMLRGYVKSLNAYIYNRWGNLIYQWSDPKGGWDGTHLGMPVNSGVYVYIIEITLYNDDKETRSGDITLVR